MSATSHGKLTTLRPFQPSDRDWAYRCATSPENLAHSRWRGATLSPHDFDQALWQGVRTQLVACCRATSRRLGLCVTYNYNPPASVHVAFQPDTDPIEPVLIADAVRTFILNVFVHDPVEKVYIELPDFVSVNLHLISRVFTREAVFADHAYWNGRLWDVSHWSLTRSDAEARANPPTSADTPLARVLDSCDSFRVWLSAALPDSVDPSASADSLTAVEVADLLERTFGLDAETTIALLASQGWLALDELRAIAAREHGAAIAASVDLSKPSDG